MDAATFTQQNNTAVRLATNGLLTMQAIFPPFTGQHIHPPTILVQNPNPSQNVLVPLNQQNRFLTRSPAVLAENIFNEIQLVRALGNLRQSTVKAPMENAVPFNPLQAVPPGPPFAPIQASKRARLSLANDQVTSERKISPIASPEPGVKVMEVSDSEEERSTSSKPQDALNDKNDAPKQAYLNGERRLIIDFETFGTRGAITQTFGRGAVLIPDGLTGYHTVYQEPWRFEVHHNPVEENTVVRITWTVKNMNTGHVHSRIETREEAKTRMTLGKTIANQVFREAMNRRALDLEETMKTEENETRRALLQSLIKYLRPTRFTQGPLVFGLQHKVVQEKLGNNAVLQDSA